MHVHASAPGKLVVAGDYAVLEGAPAVVLALDRRANVELAPGSGETFCVHAPDLGLDAVHGHLDDGRMAWDAAPDRVAKLALVTRVLQHLAGNGVLAAPLDITLDTAAFFDAAAGAKLGLGSSAALTVALSAAVFALTDQDLPDTAAMIALHRTMQGGRGSGLDIATSLLGGTVIYHLRDDQPDAVRAEWPQNLRFRCVWSGRSASTGEALTHLADWQRQYPKAYTAHMNELAVGASAVAVAIKSDDADAMLDGMAAYADGLARLGAASGIDIVCAEHRALADIARACHVVYKTCGAGGGDIGMAVATDDERLINFSRQAAVAGFHVLETDVDARGLSVHTNPRRRRSSWTTSA
ncbi:MAG TPA: hypothetical protein VF269_05675 [Rhodanobacteraceae bacterium]